MTDSAMYSKATAWVLYSISDEAGRPQEVIDWAIERYEERHGHAPNAARHTGNEVFKGCDWHGLEVKTTRHSRPCGFYLAYIPEEGANVED